MTSEEIDGVIHLTTEEVLAKRKAVLDRYGLTLDHLKAADCGCCPYYDNIPSVAFDEYRTWGWLLGE